MTHRPRARTPKPLSILDAGGSMQNMSMENAFSQQRVQGDYSADNYVKIASYVFSDEYTGPVLSWLNAGPGDRIIDLGCGSGELTVKIQNAVGAEGLVLGVDNNEDMVRHSVALKHLPRWTCFA
ncbi:hypothetical protein J3R82DRAFT_9925 [Butyriboletus roseoflavus]|nr:hypothetical protein J3R82DRAFT_9925 [Butyriboletus roseoflavus]